MNVPDVPTGANINNADGENGDERAGGDRDDNVSKSSKQQRRHRRWGRRKPTTKAPTTKVDQYDDGVVAAAGPRARARAPVPAAVADTSALAAATVDNGPGGVPSRFDEAGASAARRKSVLGDPLVVEALEL